MSRADQDNSALLDLNPLNPEQPASNEGDGKAPPKDLHIRKKIHFVQTGSVTIGTPLAPVLKIS